MAKVIVPISTSNVSIALTNNVTIDIVLPKLSLKNSYKATPISTKSVSIALLVKGRSLINVF
jgi:hypothetical protein